MTPGSAKGEVEAAARWDLRRPPYTPGSTPRPSPHDLVFSIGGDASPISADALSGSEPWLAGLHFYATGYYWEAHELWEKVWMAARPNSAERLIVQGLIQLANAALKQRMARPRAAERLAAMALSLFGDAAAGGDPRPLGVDVARLRPAIERYRSALAAGANATPPGIPFVSENWDDRDAH